MHWKPNAKIKMTNTVIRCTNSSKTLTNIIFKTAFVFVLELHKCNIFDLFSLDFWKQPGWYLELIVVLNAYRLKNTHLYLHAYDFMCKRI